MKYIVGISLILQPCTSVRDHGTGEQSLTDLIMTDSVIDTGRTNQLADNNTLRTIDDKGTGLSHQGKVTHKDLLLRHIGLFTLIM